MTDLIVEVPFDYWNKLANQVITISSLLGGFSIAIIANILVSQNDSRLVKSIMVVSTTDPTTKNYFTQNHGSALVVGDNVIALTNKDLRGNLDNQNLTSLLLVKHKSKATLYQIQQKNEKTALPAGVYFDGRPCM